MRRLRKTRAPILEKYPTLSRVGESMGEDNHDMHGDAFCVFPGRGFLHNIDVLNIGSDGRILGSKHVTK